MPHYHSSALVTGVSRGIGDALYRRLLAEDWYVWGTVRPGTAYDALKSLPPERLGGAAILELDLKNLAACGQLAQNFVAPLDVLVCSAATFAGNAFHANTFTGEAMVEAFTINTVAPAVLARGLKSRLLAGKRRLIVMMSTGNASLSGNVTGGMLAYRASKSALNQIVRNFAVEWGPEGITTVALNPGWVRSRMGGENAPLSTDEAAEGIVKFIKTADGSLNGAFVNTDGSPLPW